MNFKFEIPEAVQKELAERDAKRAKEAESKANIVQFPNFPPEKQAAPSSLLRSALFGVVRRGKRAYLEDVEIASWQGISIRYTGAKLMQSDQDVWLACVEACARQKSTNIIIPQREFMRLCSAKITNPKWLFKTLERLSCANLKLENERFEYVGSLLVSAMRDKESGHIEIILNPKLLGVFGGNVTHIDTEKRHALKMDLAKWLQGFICSHKSTWRKPTFISLEKLQDLSGVGVADMRNLRIKIRKAMGELKAANVVAGWKLENDILTLWRPKK